MFNRREYARTYSRELYQYLRARNICVYCRWKKARPGRAMCEECAAHCAQLTRARKAPAGGSV